MSQVPHLHVFEHSQELHPFPGKPVAMTDHSYSEEIFTKIRRDLPFWKPNLSLPQLPFHPKSHIYISLQACKPVLLKVRLFKAQLQLWSCCFVEETVSACTALPPLGHLRTEAVTLGCCLGSAAEAAVPGVSGLKEKSPLPPPPSP